MQPFCHSRQCLISAAVVPCAFHFLQERLRGMYDFIWYLKKMLQRIKSVLEVTWSRCYDLSRASWKILKKDAATLQCWNVLETQAKEHYHTSPNPPNPPPILKRRCYNVSRASSKILLNKMLQRSNVATSWKRRQQNVITLPLETPPPKHTVCESNNSPAPRGAPPPKTCVDSDTRNTTKQCNDDGLEGSHGQKRNNVMQGTKRMAMHGHKSQALYCHLRRPAPPWNWQKSKVRKDRPGLYSFTTNPGHPTITAPPVCEALQVTSIHCHPLSWAWHTLTLPD